MKRISCHQLIGSNISKQVITFHVTTFTNSYFEVFSTPPPLFGQLCCTFAQQRPPPVCLFIPF